jgi:hypothetical protein
MQVKPVYDDLVTDIMTFLSEAMDRAVAAGVDRAPPSSSIRESGLAKPSTTTFESSVI